MKTKPLATIIFLATIILITAPLLMITSAGPTDTFSATVSIANVGPNITFVFNGSDSPSEGTIKTIILQFNATDPNGYSDLNTSAAFMNITKSGDTTRTSTSCTGAVNSSNIQTVNCSITIYWYDGQGNWTICSYIKDNSGNATNNCSSNFSMGTLDAIDVVNTSISLSGSASQSDVGPASVIVNNTGNQNYSAVRVNATFLNNGSNIIGIGNFSVNVTNAATGEALTENTWLAITSSNLTRGTGAQRDLYFYVDIPAVPSYNYNSNRSWIIDPQ
jgi:hypothetical protein